jgi:kinesin family protein 2/24
VAKDYHLTSTFVEIYKEEVLDLYAGQMPVKMFEDFDGNIQLQGQKEIKVTQKQDLLSAISLSLIHRSTGQTEANNDSSRSHAVFTLALWDESRKPYGKFTLVDLAGAERGYERGNQDKRSRLEGAGINKSLLALKECIRLLHLKNTRKNLHIPFRDSKLTQILREILIGKNSHTAMMCCISPSSLSVEQSLNTLRYANRFKELRIDESKTVSDKIVLPHIDPEITPISELSIERIEKSFEELNEKLEDIMKEHLMCLNESSNISKEERLIIALSPKKCKKEYLSQALKLIETKIIKLTHLQAKMKALNNIS